MKIRKLSFFLAAMIALSSLASCSVGSASGDDTTVSGDDSGAQDQTSATYKGFPALEDKNFNGEEVNLLIRTEWDYEFDIDEETGDTVPDAVFKRNQAVEDKYGVDLNVICFFGAWGQHEKFTNTIHNSVLADDGEYDMIAGYQAVLTTNIQNGDLLDLNKVPHLSLNAPWWTQEGVEALTYNNKIFMAGGDVTLSLLEGIYCMFYNKALAEDYSTPDLYELVRNGEWTHAKMAEVTKGLYSDVNSNDTKDKEDNYGMVTATNNIRQYIVSYDTPTISKEGEIIWLNEHTIDVVERLVDFFAQPENFAGADTNKAFTSSRALMINSTLGSAANFRSMEDDFGIIPIPKFNSEQKDYMTTTRNDVSMMCVPITAPDVDKSGFILEALCRESTDTVATSFYDVALEGKYARDEESLEMIGIIRDGLTFDFGWIHSMATNVSGARYENLVVANDANFASQYAEQESVTEEQTNKLLECYE